VKAHTSCVFKSTPLILTIKVVTWQRSGTVSLPTMLISMALRAQGDQVLIHILATLTTLLYVVHLEVGSRPAGLTSPPIAP
jgi:hypothetical protein